MVAQSNGQVAGRQHIVAGSGIKLVHASRGDKIAEMSTILHEDAQHSGGVEILRSIHVNCMEGNGSGEFGVKIENPLIRLLFWPILAKSNRMGDEGWVGVVQDGNDGKVTTVAALHALHRNRIGWDHGRILESGRNHIQTRERGGRYQIQNLEHHCGFETAAHRVRDINSTGIAVFGERSIPRSKSMERSNITIRDGLLKFLRVID